MITELERVRWGALGVPWGAGVWVCVWGGGATYWLQKRHPTGAATAVAAQSRECLLLPDCGNSCLTVTPLRGGGRARGAPAWGWR